MTMRITLGPLLRVNGRVTPTMRRSVITFWIGGALLLWFFSPIKALPTPLEIAQAIADMHWNNALVRNLGLSMKLNVYGLALSTLISLPVSYLTVLPVFRPLTTGVAVARYLPIAGFSLIFMILFGTGFGLKLALLTAGTSYFLVTSLVARIATIPRSAYEHARVLGYNDWQVFTTVVVRGTLHDALEIIGQNSAIGWGMIVFIEAINKSEGGIGAMIQIFFGTFSLAKSYGCLFIIGVVACAQDLLFQAAKRVLFPYSVLEDRG
jgi:NitT/TauT family transport system permease protein